MANPPTLCQKYVTQTIDPFRLQFPETYIIHYMDDVLIATRTPKESHTLAVMVVQALQKRGFHIAPEKIQTQFSFLFLGFELHPDLLYTQKFQVRKDSLKTLNDL